MARSGVRAPLWREVERVLLSDREIELRLQWVQQKVDLVHYEQARFEELERLHEAAHVGFEGGSHLK